MKHPITAAALALGLLAPSFVWAAPGPVEDLSVTQPDGGRVLRERVVIDAPRSMVWKVFVDVPTIKAGGVPAAWVDLRDGGSIEEAFDPKARPGGADNIRHLIIVQVPEHLLVARNQNGPFGLPGREAFKQIVQVVELNDAGAGRTELTLAGYGYLKGEDFDKLYGFFHDHNIELLGAIKAQCEAAARKN